VNRPAKQTQPIFAKFCPDPGTSEFSPGTSLELSGNRASVDLLRITRLESNKIAGKWLQILRERA
jgi:hypothetical protein